MMPRLHRAIARASRLHGAKFRGNARGMSLVELMTGITIGMLILAAMAVLFANNSAARNEIERTGQQIENGRFAFQLLRDDIHLAGYFYGYTGGARQFTEACVPRNGVALNATALGWQVAPPRTPLPIQGYAAGDTPASETCISNQKANTDVLILRSVETSAISVGSAAISSNANDYFMQTSACADVAIDPVDQPFVVAPGGIAAPADSA